MICFECGHDVWRSGSHLETVLQDAYSQKSSLLQTLQRRSILGKIIELYQLWTANLSTLFYLI